MDSNPLFYKNILDNLHEGVYFVDQQGVITYWNKGAEQLSGYAASEVLGFKCSHNLLMHVDTRGCNICSQGCPLSAATKAGTSAEKVLFMLHKEGHRVPIVVRAMPYYDVNEKIIGAVEIFYNNTKQKQQEEKMKQLAKLAFSDEVTGAANRRYGEMKLNTVLDEVKKGMDAGVLAIELRPLKNNNITFEAELDDETMKIIGKTLISNVQEGDIVCRWDKNQFILVLRNNRKSTLLLLADKFKSLMLQSRLTKSFKGDKLYVAIGGAFISTLDKTNSVVERAIGNAKMSLQMEGSRVIID